MIEVKSKFRCSGVITHKEFPMTVPGLVSALAEADDQRGHIAQAAMVVLMGDSRTPDGKYAYKRGSYLSHNAERLARCTWVEIRGVKLTEEEEKHLKPGSVDFQISNCRAFLSDFPTYE